ncbi:HD-GYP domain-containing protein [Rossellomorea aquimaris]|uniref:HD-GYP domain-containing protein n=1 Tax=Rossellomorea aquimaris TaxID=189382 RepID=UPI001CD2EE6F|nr:HD-GYP domain-containing protein [Rossellomorea aquimaris]MCA1061133.1 HD-GYP domain-containing protein [Rossellomorea aquimaris]
MKVHRGDIQLGCIVAEDIMGMAASPIIPKSTVIEEEHLNILQAFHIDELYIEKTKADGNPFRSLLSADKSSDQEDSDIYEPYGFVDLYLTTVKEFKKEFMNWQSGTAVNVARVREFILPVIQVVEENHAYVYSLPQYSTKKDYLYHHAVSVSIISALIGKKLGLNSGQVNQLALAGALSDCGMSKVSPHILLKEQPLTESEFKEVKLHTANGYKMVKDTPLLKTETKLAIFQHHERFDGTGYPASEKSDRIHLYSQIVGISDVFHAMTSERMYRTRQPVFKVLDMISKDLFGKFDIKVVEGLLQLLGDLRTGTPVKLSTGETGEVMYTKPNAFISPIVKLKSGQLIDLSQQKNIYISEVMT